MRATCEVTHTKLGTPSTEIQVFKSGALSLRLDSLPLINEFTIPYLVYLSTNRKHSVSYKVIASGDISMCVNISSSLLSIQ